MKTTSFLVALALLCLFVNQTSWSQTFQQDKLLILIDSLYKSDPDITHEEFRRFMREYHQKQADDYYQAYLQKIAKQKKSNMPAAKSKSGGIAGNMTLNNSTTSQGQVPDAVEYAALKALYDSTGGNGWTHNDNWLQGTTSADFDLWYGIKVMNGDVVEISFYNNNLIDTLPSEIGNLSSLELLDLNNNQLASIPSEIGSLSNLQRLYLLGNQLTSIPSEIGNLSSLHSIHFGGNQLTSLPVEIGNLNLLSLDIGGNLFTSIPSVIESLSNLQQLNLGGNQLTSISVEVVNLPALQLLLLYTNQLNSLPNFSNHSNLMGLNLHVQGNFINLNDIARNLIGPDNYAYSGFYYNPQNNPLGDTTTRLTALGSSVTLQGFTNNHPQTRFQWQYASTGTSTWTDVAGQTQENYTIASVSLTDAGQYRCKITNDWISNMTQYSAPIILEIDTGDINSDTQALHDFVSAIQNAGNLPTSWNINNPVSTWQGITVENGRVTKVLLRNKGLQGSIPTSFGNLTGLKELDLGQNQFTGSIPTSLGRMYNLKVLNLEKNQLSGAIPSQLGNLTNLDFLYLNDNTLTGSIPSSFGNFSRLQVLNMGKNQLSGTLPGELGNLGNLGHLFLGYNQFSGQIPATYTNLLKLQRIDLINNQLSGSIPSWLGNLKNVYLLSLGGNQFSGAIPAAIGDMSSLKQLQLWGNQLSGSIPGALGKLQNLEYLHLYNNQLSGSVPNELSYLYKLREIRLHQNELTCIPDFSSLSLLNRLEINNNRLTFECLIPNRNVPNFLTNPNYFSPQKEVGILQNIPVSSCQSYPIKLDFDHGITNNQYQWHRNNTLFFTNNTNSFQLETSRGTGTNFFGEFFAKITNPLFPGLTLTSRKITVTNNLAAPCENGVSAYNYVQTQTILTEGQKNESTLIYLGNKELNDHYDYIDGLGRLMQQVGKGVSPLSKDVIQPVEYDQYGREKKRYLPYVTGEQSGNYRSDYTSKQPNFYLASNDKITDTGSPYSETVFENSPLNRVKEQGAPGSDWQPTTPGDPNNKTIKFTYRSNQSSEAVRRWTYDYTNKSITSTGNYGAGQLYVTETKDESNQAVWEYKDKLGRVVLKKVAGVDENGASINLLTYYIYDDWGNLRVVIPPKASATLSTSTITKNLSDDFITKGCFSYDYDSHQRMVSKQVPGTKPVWMIYDELDRVVLTQDGEQRKNAKKQWTFTKYDALNRPIMTGIYTHGTDYQNNPAGMQSEMNTKNFTEQYTGASNNFGYSDSGFPTVISSSNVILLTVAYYDDYRFKTDVSTHFGSAYDFQNVSSNNTLAQYPTTHFSRVKGQVTGSLVRVIDSNDWLSSISYYDEHSQLIQTITENYPQGLDVMTTQYDFTGKLINSLRIHEGFAPYTSLSINQRYVYDHAGRVTSIYYKINNEVEVLQASYSYNELGQLVEKNLHKKLDGNFLQSIDYRYNERGWLTNINAGDLSNDASVNDDNNDLFGMHLYYNQATSFGSIPQYNGNITAVEWTNQTGISQQEAYAYEYDKLNRLGKALYKNLNDNTKNGWYDVKGLANNAISYDLNGNIKRLSRYGNALTKIDDLQYEYSDGSAVGNQLQWVTDYGSSASGMNDGNTTGNDYGYDDNGNLSEDLNKNINSIVYNHLNLPKEITFSNNNVIRYIYDATGAKLKKEVVENGITTATYYINGIQYHSLEQGVTPIVLDFIATAEGRVTPFTSLPVEPCATISTTNLQSGPWVYQYDLKDHVGNVRLTLSSELITEKYLATMETDGSTMEIEGNIESSEEAAFLNLSAYRSLQQAFNATVANGCSEITNPNEVALVVNSTDNTEALAKSLMVQRGDQIYVEVKAQYFQESSLSPQAIANIAGAVISSMGGGAGIETQAVRQSSHEIASIGAVANTNTSPVPPAALYILVFDQNHQQIGNPIIQSITEAARVTPENPDQPHETLSYTLSINQPGYIYVYLWNESSTAVYFDDFLVEHQHGSVVQADDYYPFGLALQSREDFENKELYQGKEYQSELGLHTYDFHARQYDPVLGRFMSIDPASQFASPYLAMGNNPVVMVDPDGEFVVVGMALLGAYLLTSSTEGTFNPTKWAWDGGTFTSLAIGGGMGALGGGILANGGQAFVGLSNAVGKVGATITMKGLAGAGYAAGALTIGSLTWETMAGGSGNIAVGPTPDPIVNTYRPEEGISDETFNRILARKYGGLPGSIEVGTVMSVDQYNFLYGPRYTIEELMNMPLASGAVIPDYTIESWLIGGSGVYKGFNAVKSAVGPLKQWIRYGPSWSHAGGFKTKAIRWGASPAKKGKYLMQIGSSTLRKFNQWLRNKRIPIDHWRFRDPGHIHIKKI